jgi:hypothetical protein
MSYKTHELLALGVHMGSPPVFDGVCVANLFSFLRCVVCVLFVFVLCLVFSLDCPFLSVPSVFAKVFCLLFTFICVVWYFLDH